MAYTRMTAAEAAALINNNDNIAMSGFTPAGVAKAVTRELAKKAEAESVLKKLLAEGMSADEILAKLK